MKEGSSIPDSGNIRSNLFGLTVTTLFLFVLIHLHTAPLTRLSHSTSPEKKEDIEIQWAVKSIEEPKEDSKRFVEANPNSQINPPDETNNFSFQDQQAAQPTISINKKEGEMPETEGVEFSSKISPAIDASPLSKKLPPPAPQNQKKNLPKKKQEEEPRKMSVKETNQKLLNEKGIDVKSSDKEERKRIIDLSKNKKIKDSNIDRGDDNIAMTSTIETNTIETKPRPKLSPDLLRGPVMKTVSSAPRMGVLAIECRLHPYGVYVQEMLRAIEDQWHHLARGSLHFLQKDKLKSKITYRFTLKADGTINDLALTTKGGSTLPAELCRQAIASRVPYGEWTQQMIDDFGKSDEITIHFNYR